MRVMAWLAGLLTAVLFMNGCARVDWLALSPPEGRTPAQVERDRQECEAEAKPSAGRLAEGAGEGLAIHFLAPLVGAGAGALAGLTAAAGSGSTDTEGLALIIVGGAAVGAVIGLVVGVVLAVDKPASRLADERRQAYDACLRRRGYTLPSGER